MAEHINEAQLRKQRGDRTAAKTREFVKTNFEKRVGLEIIPVIHSFNNSIHIINNTILFLIYSQNDLIKNNLLNS